MFAMHLARGCRTLLGTVRLQRLWTKRGPTHEVIDLLEANGGYLSSGERVMVSRSLGLLETDRAGSRLPN